MRKLRHIHEVRSVIVSDAANNRSFIAPTTASSAENQRNVISYYNTQSNGVTDVAINPDEAIKIMNMNANIFNIPVQNSKPVGKYLELVHSS